MTGEIELEGLIRLSRRDGARAAAVLAEAFADDPVFEHLMPEPQSRRRAVDAVMRVFVSTMMLSCDAYATSGGMEGVLFVTFPGRRGFSLWSVPALAQSLLLPFRLARHVPLGAMLKRARLLSKPTSEMRRRVKALGRHVHVDMIAVAERYRGQKFMSRMMRAVLSEAARRGERCVLETETETNERIYRHFGFRQDWKMEAVPGRLTYYVMAYDPENAPKAGDL